MPITVHNPYSGKDEETCSVSFAAQNAAMGTTGSTQTEEQYNKSSQLGTIGVLQGKAANGELKAGTKLLDFENAHQKGSFVWTGFSVYRRFQKKLKNGTLSKKVEIVDTTWGVIQQYIRSSENETKIPGGGGPSNSEPEKVEVNVAYSQTIFKKNKAGELTEGQVVAEMDNGDKMVHVNGLIEKHVKIEYGYQKVGSAMSPSGLIDPGETWYQVKQSGPDKGEAKTTPSPAAPPVAAPTAKPAVSTGSASVGSMSHEDVATMFVLIKDKLAAEKGVNIKGANAALDQEVYEAIGKETGYTAADVKAKIDAYKAAGNKLSALKKKTLKNGMPKTTTVKPSPPANAPASAPPPKPVTVPTEASKVTVNKAAETVTAKVEAKPTKLYTDEDIAAQYIIAKDAVVAASGGKWTLYTKDPEMDLEIAVQVGLKTGYNPTQQKTAVANYLATGKKLSALKKALAKQGAFTPKADTMKAKTPTTPAATAATINMKAATAAPPPATSVGTAKMPDAGKGAVGDPPIAKVKPTKTAEEKAREAGDISKFLDIKLENIYNHFKAQPSSFVGSNAQDLYNSFAKTAKSFGITKLQAVRAVDAWGAKNAKLPNKNLFEKKMVTWLTTPAGKNAALSAEAKLAAKLDAEKKLEALKASQPPLPADSAQFKVVDEAWMQRWRKRGNSPLTAAQKTALIKYTGNAYTTMNAYYRSDGKKNTSEAKDCATAKAGMRPLDEPVVFHRGCDMRQFGLESGNTEAAYGLVGKSILDKAFISTSYGGNAAFSGEVLMEIQCPPGTKGMYVNDFSRFKGEDEFLMSPGTRYRVLRVEPISGKKVKVIVRVEV